MRIYRVFFRSPALPDSPLEHCDFVAAKEATEACLRMLRSVFVEVIDTDQEKSSARIGQLQRRHIPCCLCFLTSLGLLDKGRRTGSPDTAATSRKVATLSFLPVAIVFNVRMLRVAVVSSSS